ncbi:hypothetical protein TNCV_1730441 [Trichonephila clavipes]|nr:hypothetical protein TNCV_1730441 [Trichonephila clavipes]
MAVRHMYGDKIIDWLEEHSGPLQQTWLPISPGMNQIFVKFGRSLRSPILGCVVSTKPNRISFVCGQSIEGSSTERSSTALNPEIWETSGRGCS